MKIALIIAILFLSTVLSARIDITVSTNGPYGDGVAFQMYFFEKMFSAKFGKSEAKSKMESICDQVAIEINFNKQKGFGSISKIPTELEVKEDGDRGVYYTCKYIKR